MQKFKVSLILALIAAVVSTGIFPPLASAQKEKKPEEPKADLKRVISRHEAHRLPYGGTLSIVGAPVGSITIEGWNHNEVDVAAEIELHGPTNSDLDLLATVNNFAVDVDTNHVRIITSGTHDKKYMRQVARKFPKNLFGLAWKVDFHIKVPALTDIEIDAGIGPLKLSRVDVAAEPGRQRDVERSSRQLQSHPKPMPTARWDPDSHGASLNDSREITARQ